MKLYNLIALFVFMLTCSIYAQDKVVKELQTTVKAPEIQKQFDQPDGAAIFLKDDGSFQIFARGTGTYDFDDADDVNDARKEGFLKAKATIAKFMKEKLSTEESLENTSKKVKTITTDTNTQTANINKESIKKVSATIKVSSEALLRGVITLKEHKVPSKGSSGQIQVTIGISSKTITVADKLDNAINRKQGIATQTKKLNGSNNKVKIRKAVTDF